MLDPKGERQWRCTEKGRLGWPNSISEGELEMNENSLGRAHHVH